jgi:hypothetical protein
MEILDPGLIGGFLLPVLGALPDATIIFFACLGTAAVAQNQLVSNTCIFLEIHNIYYTRLLELEHLLEVQSCC